MRVSQAGLLRSVDLFEGLQPNEIENIEHGAESFSFDAGEFLYRQADPAEKVFVVESGHVEISVRVPGDERIVVGEASSGGVVGEICLLRTAVRTSSARCSEPTYGLSIRRDDLEKMLWYSPSPASIRVLRRVLGRASERLRQVTDNIACVIGDGLDEPGDSVGERESEQVGQFREMPRADELAHVPFFSAFEPEEREELARRMTCREISRGDVLFEEGDAADSCFVVARGAVEVRVNRRNVSERVALLGPGKMVGHLALIDPAPRSATCVIRETATLFELGTSDFEALLEGVSPSSMRFMDSLVRLMSDGLGRSERRLTHLALTGKARLGR